MSDEDHSLEALELRLQRDLATMIDEKVHEATEDRRREDRRLRDQIATLRDDQRVMDVILRGDGTDSKPGLAADVRAIRAAQKRREWLERTGIVLLLGLVVKALWELVVR